MYVQLFVWDCELVCEVGVKMSKGNIPRLFQKNVCWYCMNCSFEYFWGSKTKDQNVVSSQTIKDRRLYLAGDILIHRWTWWCSWCRFYQTGTSYITSTSCRLAECRYVLISHSCNTVPALSRDITLSYSIIDVIFNDQSSSMVYIVIVQWLHPIQSLTTWS